MTKSTYDYENLAVEQDHLSQAQECANALGRVAAALAAALMAWVGTGVSGLTSVRIMLATTSLACVAYAAIGGVRATIQLSLFTIDDVNDQRLVFAISDEVSHWSFCRAVQSLIIGLASRYVTLALMHIFIGYTVADICHSAGFVVFSYLAASGMAGFWLASVIRDWMFKCDEAEAEQP